jgi:hypothetical protein
MTDKPIPQEPEILSCKICLEEIPSSVSNHGEGDEYAQHFCGIECYSIWKKLEQDETVTDDNG